MGLRGPGKSQAWAEVFLIPFVEPRLAAVRWTGKFKGATLDGEEGWFFYRENRSVGAL